VIRSMTGYGGGESQEGSGRWRVEVKVVNHRFREIVIRLPKEVSSLEEQVRRCVSENISRGRVEVSVTREGEPGWTHRLVVDRTLALEYYKNLNKLASELDLEFKPQLSDLARFEGIFSLEVEPEDLEKAWENLEPAVRSALNEVVRMREAEGRALLEDFQKRVNLVREMVGLIQERADLTLDEYREKLQARVAELIETGALETGRLEAEVVLYAERSNITEELVRIRSHLSQMEEAFESNSPVGRRIEFILQELWREINTVGSKTGDTEIGRLVVQVKDELEKMREQAQNIE